MGKNPRKSKRATRAVALAGLELSDLTNVSAFIGPMLDKRTNQKAMCEMCKDNEAPWIHFKKVDNSRVGLCFGCGDH